MSLARKLLIALLLLSSIVMGVGVLSPWWTGVLPTGSFDVGLRKMTLCMEQICRERGLSDAGGGAKGWAKLGSGVFAAGCVSVLFLVHCAVRRCRHQTRKISCWLGGVFTLFTGLMALLFISTGPDFGAWVPTYGTACTLSASLVGSLAIMGGGR